MFNKIKAGVLCAAIMMPAPIAVQADTSEALNERN